MLYAGLILGSMTLVVAYPAAQESPDRAAALVGPEAAPRPPMLPDPNSKDSAHAPSADDDFDKLLLLLATAASGLVGAQVLRRWRRNPLRHIGSGSEEIAMSEPDPVPPSDATRAEITHTQPIEQVTPEPVSETTPAAAPGVEFAPQPELSAIPPATVALPAATPGSPHPSVTARQPSTVDAIQETRASHSHQSWVSFNRDAIPRLLFYGGSKFCQFSADKLHAADDWFVIGDIHGDFYALHAIVSHIRKTCPQFGIIFLGDLIDRGPHPIECLWYLLKLADDHPERVLWLAGNHDVGARYDEETGRFRSTVEPAEFVADLNIVDSFAPLRRAFGREYIELAEGLPRAALMPDGLLLTHGGFPHTDLQAELAGLTLNSDRRKWLESEAAVRDFTHLRITKYPLRRPNRLSICCSYGYQDFDAFKRSMSGYGVTRLVTGHQHAATGFESHPEWAKNGHEALTLTGFGFADAYDRLDSYAINYRRTLTMGRCRPDQIPEVVQISVDEQDLAAFYDAEIKTMRRFAVS